jgi:RNA polymerase sigma-70 factor (ECF subfamily)
MGPNDADLIREWQAGDHRAFEALVFRWQPALARLLGRLVGRHDLASDLCQEVFLRVYLAGARYRETGSFSVWLYRIALNVARDAGRRARRLPGPLPAEVDPADPGAAAEALCQQHESAEIVARALAELPEPLREILVLRHYEDMSFASIARLTGVPVSTVKSRVAAALERLRVRLRPLNENCEEQQR